MTENTDWGSVVSPELWHKLLERDEFMCLNCMREEDLQPAHYVARSLAPTQTQELDNLMLLCSECHRRLHDRKLRVRRINGHFFFKELRY